MKSDRKTRLGLAKTVLLAIRNKWGVKPRFTMPEIAQKAGLPIEYLTDVPAKYDARLDPHPLNPRFIAVNSNLPQHERIFAIARELGFYAQGQRHDSHVLNRPWKWKVLDTAPEAVRQQICFSDAEYRAYWLMVFFATGDEFRSFVKKHPKKILAISFADHAVAIELYALRLKMWIRSLMPSSLVSRF